MVKIFTPARHIPQVNERIQREEGASGKRCGARPRIDGERRQRRARHQIGAADIPDEMWIERPGHRDARNRRIPGGGIAEHDTVVLGGGGIAEQDSAVLGAGGIAEQEESAVRGDGGMTEQDTVVLGGGGIAEQDTVVLGGGGMTGPSQARPSGSS